MHRFVAVVFAATVWVTSGWAEVPVQVGRVEARHAVVVAGHPEAAEAGLEVLRSGGNVIDAAVATSLALGVAEPYGSGLGGKLMLLYREAATGRVHVVDAMDAAGSLNVPEYLARPEQDRTYGYGSVCVPGLPAGLWEAHRRWGGMRWSRVVAPAIELARTGFRVLPKTREAFAEQERKLRRGDPEIARLYLPDGKLPEAGSRLPNPDLARTLEAYSARGREGFYRGAIGEALARASRNGGGTFTAQDLANYEARVTSGVTMELRGYTLVSSPPPTSGAALFFPLLKVFETEPIQPPLRSAENLDRIGRAWRVLAPQVSRAVGDMEHARFLVERLLAPDTIAEVRAKAWGAGENERQRKVGGLPGGRVSGATELALAQEPAWYESPEAATTHFLVADAEGNIVCVTQSQSLHFGSGVVAPGTGVVLNNSMSNFSFIDPTSINYVAPRKRSRSTIAPTLVLQGDRPVLALGLPGASRIPTAMLQVLFDRLLLGRPLDEAIGDTRVHYFAAYRSGDVEAFEAEQSFPAEEVRRLEALGWKVNLPEPAGTGRYFGGINAIEYLQGGGLAGYADPRRTNVAVGY